MTANNTQARDAWGNYHVSQIKLPCGSIALFDADAGYGYRCTDCFAVVGSIGQPKECVEEAKKYDTWKRLGGKGWNYKV